MELKIVKNTCPYCEDVFYANVRTYANHVRWCKKNPRYHEILNKTLEKLKGEKVERKTFQLKCENCGNPYEVVCTEKEFLRGFYNKTCGNSCAKKLSVKKGGKERNNKISEGIKKYYALTKEGYDEINGCFVKTCEKCGNVFNTKKSKQRFCSKKCYQKFRYELSKIKAKEYEIYRTQCCFKFDLKEFPQEFDFALITEHGWYKAENHGDNLNGVSRDHMLSVNYGYKNNIDPYIISHPSNCELMIHPENATKNFKCSITKEELLEKILQWEKKYGVYPNKINYFGIESFKS